MRILVSALVQAIDRREHRQRGDEHDGCSAIQDAVVEKWPAASCPRSRPSQAGNENEYAEPSDDGAIRLSLAVGPQECLGQFHRTPATSGSSPAT
jgi:hypothetical protein